jgi:tetratricopeptide (TPR) repeat protein
MLGWSVADLLALRSAFAGFNLAPRGVGGDPTRAEREAERAVHWMPWDDVIAQYRARTLIMVAASADRPGVWFDEAEASARRAIRLAPTRAAAYQCLGAVLLERAYHGDASALPRAEAVFGRCFELAPYNALMRLELANGEIALGRPQAALPLIRRTLELYPDQPAVRNLLAMAPAQRLRTIRSDSTASR